MTAGSDPSLTLTGVAMGTAGYMSPEQVRGEKLDARTDLFSFGLVLYEMATGQQPFTGDTVPALHDAILTHSPVPARQLNPALPSKLEAITNRALEKDREARYQTAAEIRSDLETLKQGMEPKPRSRWRWIAAAVFAVAILASAASWFAKRQRASNELPLQLKLRQLTNYSSDSGAAGGGMISPDGKYLAHLRSGWGCTSNSSKEARLKLSLNRSNSRAGGWTGRLARGSLTERGFSPLLIRPEVMPRIGLRRAPVFGLYRCWVGLPVSFAMRPTQTPFLRMVPPFRSRQTQADLVTEKSG